MIKMKIITMTVLLMLIIFASEASALLYKNSRYGFTVDIPNADFNPGQESSNGDGRSFVFKSDPNFILKFYAANQVFEESILHNLAWSLPKEASFFRHILEEDVFYLEYIDRETRQIVKTHLQDEVLYTMSVQYPAAMTKKYDPLCQKVMQSWKIPRTRQD